MKHIKLFEEYRYFKVDQSIDNVKDLNEPFFNEPKYDYKKKKIIFGDEDFTKYGKNLIEINNDVIDKLLNDNITEKVRGVLFKIKKCVGYYDYYLDYIRKHGDDEETDDLCPDNEIVVSNLYNEDVKQLMNFGFGLKIYDDSNEFSDDFNDKYKIWWEWKVKNF